MQHAIVVVTGLTLTLLHLVITGIAAIETVLRDALAPMGLGSSAQNAVLLVTALVLIVGAIRLFGRLFALLISVVLLLLILHILLPGVHG